ncbi:HugZ family protein [Stappia sp. TSB10P1A]|uniref:HugZ family pyridoxamine 5'-phosphate oxidase n=1 Tax=Stappia sp. TSB10P1A TaxID=2003585 RepID=UPI001643809A|nr:DUF2470 domain-containing protein [Stappia sp. TSB10P1A]
MAEDDRPEVIRPTDDEARHLSRRLMRLARYGALGVLDPADGMPFVSRVGLATEMDGTPVMLVSRLSQHTGAILADPRCSLLVGEPGKGDPLAHPRLSLVGRAERIDPADPAHAAVRRRYLLRHPKAQLYVDFPDFAFFRIVPERASLNGGFGKAYHLTAEDLLLSGEVLAELAAAEAGAVEHMNQDHLDAVRLYAQTLAKARPGPWRLSSLDPAGLDLVDGDRVARLDFDPPLESAGELRPRLVALAKRARAGE